MKRIGLSNNQLKIIAMLTMLVDHIGVILYPDIDALRYIGRIAMPIFAFMIAEGVTHTKDRIRYLLMIFALGIGCQIAYLVAEQSLYQNILITFSLSIILIYSIDNFAHDKSIVNAISVILAVFFVAFLCIGMPKINSDFYIDYGLFGVILPVVIYFVKGKWHKLLFATIMLLPIVLELGDFQIYSLNAIPLLALYNGQRGKLRLKYMFYIFYPLHLGILYLISMYA